MWIWINKEYRASTTYECGYENRPGRMAYVMYYKVGLMFILFDIEISYLYPFARSYNVMTIKTYWMIYGWMTGLGIGYIYEMKTEKMEKWKEKGRKKEYS